MTGSAVAAIASSVAEVVRTTRSRYRAAKTALEEVEAAVAGVEKTVAAIGRVAPRRSRSAAIVPLAARPARLRRENGALVASEPPAAPPEQLPPARQGLADVIARVRAAQIELEEAERPAVRTRGGTSVRLPCPAPAGLFCPARCARVCLCPGLYIGHLLDSDAGVSRNSLKTMAFPTGSRRCCRLAQAATP
jgi:hypothetical protein